MKKVLYLMLTVFCVVCLSGCGKKYTVTFDTDGGTKVEEIKVKKNATIEVLPTTTKDGYTFIEWQLNGKKFNKNTKITSNITLKASWQKNAESSVDVKKYTITFNTDGGSKIESVEVEENKTLTKPENPTKEGYTFDKWMLNNKEYDFDTKVTKNITLKATWKKQDNKKQYTVTFNTDGGSSISSKKVAEGTRASKPTNPTRDGYTFVEWQLDGKIYNFNTVVTKDITLKAVWKKNGETKPVEEKYTVSFDSNGGSSKNNQIVVAGNKANKPANPTKNGYTFVEWQLDGKTYDFNTPVTKDITLKAVWKKNEEPKPEEPTPVEEKYTVSFDSNGGSGVASQTIVKGNKVTKPADPTRSGYTFEGWTLNGSSYDFNTPVNGDITLKANWKEVVVTKTYTAEISLVDSQTTDRYITIKENGTPIKIAKLMYTDGTEVMGAINGTKISVGWLDIKTEKEFKVQLLDGSIVTAKAVIKMD